MLRITFRQIEVFIAVAKTENMTHAAEVLHLTQSACSMALSTMETQLGGVLFDRHGKKLILNERGRALFSKAANIITQIKEIQDLMTEKNEASLAGHIVLGASTTIGNYLLPRIIGNFVTTHPQTKIKLRIANTKQIIRHLLKFNIDAGMIEGSCYDDQVEVIPWMKDELIVTASSKHPLSKKRKITYEDICSARWILREPGSGTREKFEEALSGKVNPFLELGHTEAIKRAVLEGLGISCLSRTTVAESLKNRQLVELKTPYLKLTRDFFMILHKEKHKTAVLREFMNLCVQECKK